VRSDLARQVRSDLARPVRSDLFTPAPKARNMIARGKREAQLSASPLDQVNNKTSNPERA